MIEKIYTKQIYGKSKGYSIEITEAVKLIREGSLKLENIKFEDRKKLTEKLYKDEKGRMVM